MRRAISSLAWGIQKKSSEYRGFDLLDEGGCMDEFDIEHTVYCSSIWLTMCQMWFVWGGKRKKRVSDSFLHSLSYDILVGMVSWIFLRSTLTLGANSEGQA